MAATFHTIIIVKLFFFYPHHPVVKAQVKAQVNVVGDQRYLVSINIELQEEANATFKLVGTTQGSMLLPNARIKGAIKQKVLLI